MGNERSNFGVVAIDHVVINATDANASAAWYAKVLGMRRAPAKGREILYFGQQKIHVRPVSISKEQWFTADHEAAGSDDLCFLVETDAQSIVDHLTSCDVAIEVGPVARDGARGPMTSVYCRDPDGSLIEIATYGTRLASSE